MLGTGNGMESFYTPCFVKHLLLGKRWTWYLLSIATSPHTISVSQEICSDFFQSFLLKFLKSQVLARWKLDWRRKVCLRNGSSHGCGQESPALHHVETCRVASTDSWVRDLGEQGRKEATSSCSPGKSHNVSTKSWLHRSAYERRPHVA